MSKKKKIRIAVWSVILFTVFSFLWTFNWNPLVPVSFLATLPANKEKKEMYANRKYKKVKEPLKVSCVNPENATVKKPENAVDTIDIVNTEGYRKMRGYINELERAANALKAIQTTYDVFGTVNPDAIVDILPFLIMKKVEDIMALPKEADFAMIDAMCDPSIEWETKYCLSQLLGDRGAREALPIFREIAEDENEPFLLRITSIDQLGTLEDREARNLFVDLLDNPDNILRDKGSSTLRDITDQGDEEIYGIVSSHFYDEKDEVVRECLLGTMILIGGEDSLPEVKEILKTATRGEKITTVFSLEDIHSETSFEMLKDMYDPQDEDSFSLVISSLAKLEMEEANEFLYGIIEEVNGGNSVMAASYLIDQRNKEVIPYIEQALKQETNEEFIRCYQDMLKKTDQ